MPQASLGLESDLSGEEPLFRKQVLAADDRGESPTAARSALQRMQRGMVVSLLVLVALGGGVLFVPFDEVAAFDGMVRLKGAETGLTLPGPGVVRRVLASQGQKVKAGDVLMECEPPALAGAVATERLKVQGLEVSKGQLEIQLAALYARVRDQEGVNQLLVAKVERYDSIRAAQDRLFKDGLASRLALVAAENDLDEARAALVRGQQSLKVLKGEIAALGERVNSDAAKADASLKGALAQGEEFWVRAPFDGVVEWIEGSPGRSVTGTDVLVRMVPNGKRDLEIQGALPWKAGLRVRPGQVARAFASDEDEPQPWPQSQALVVFVGKEPLAKADLEKLDPSASGVYVQVAIGSLAGSFPGLSAGDHPHCEVLLGRTTLMARGWRAIKGRR